MIGIIDNNLFNRIKLVIKEHYNEILVYSNKYKTSSFGIALRALLLWAQHANTTFNPLSLTTVMAINSAILILNLLEHYKLFELPIDIRLNRKTYKLSTQDIACLVLNIVIVNGYSEKKHSHLSTFIRYENDVMKANIDLGFCTGVDVGNSVGLLSLNYGITKVLSEKSKELLNLVAVLLSKVKFDPDSIRIDKDLSNESKLCINQSYSIKTIENPDSKYEKLAQDLLELKTTVSNIIESNKITKKYIDTNLEESKNSCLKFERNCQDILKEIKQIKSLEKEKDNLFKQLEQRVSNLENTSDEQLDFKTPLAGPVVPNIVGQNIYMPANLMGSFSLPQLPNESSFDMQDDNIELPEYPEDTTSSIETATGILKTIDNTLTLISKKSSEILAQDDVNLQNNNTDDKKTNSTLKSNEELSKEVINFNEGSSIQNKEETEHNDIKEEESTELFQSVVEKAYEALENKNEYLLKWKIIKDTDSKLLLLKQNIDRFEQETVNRIGTAVIIAMSKRYNTSYIIEYINNLKLTDEEINELRSMKMYTNDRKTIM